MRVLSFGLMSACILSSGVALSDIGTVSAVNRDMDGTPPAAERRNLLLGDQVVRNERVETSSQGSGQLMFLDQTTLTVAPNSNIIIDEYVYAPESSGGEMAITLTKGALRFIGGRLTKSRTAVIRTPTATIGVRGGMAIIRVLEDGSTQVVMLAGEFVRVEGSGPGTSGATRVINLGRANASALVSLQGDVTFTGVLSAADLSAEYRAFEGRSTGGSQRASESTKDSIQQAAAPVSEINSEVSGGAQRQPVSTSGEQDIEPRDQSAEIVNDSVSQTGQVGSLNETEAVFQIASQDGSILFTPTPPTEGGGAIVPPDPGVGGGSGPVATPLPPTSVPTGGAVLFDGAAATTFTTIESGSFIGIDATGRTLTLPVAGTDIAFFDPTTEPFNPFPDFDNSNPNTGLILFDETSGASDSVLGALAGFGFADLDQNFHVYEFETLSTEELAIAFFADSGEQFGLLPSNSDGSGDRATQNAVEVFRPLDFDFGGVDDDEQVLIVGNPGISGASSGSGQRVLFAEVDIGTDSFLGTPSSEFSVYTAERDSSETGVSFTGDFRTTRFQVDRYFVEELSIGTLSDDTGATVFGTDSNYLLLAGVTGDQLARVSDSGVTEELGGAVFEEDFSAAVLERDAALGGLVDATPLTGQNLFPDGSSFNGRLDTGAISGIAICSTGECGDFQPASSAPIGAYSLGANFGNDIRFDFDLGLDGTLDENSIENFRFQVSDNDLSNITGPTDQFLYTVPGLLTDTTAFADDNRFVVSLGQVEQTIRGQVSPDNTASLILASSGSAGDGGFAEFAGAETQPEFARWGWWSSRIDTNESGVPRQDLVHLGTWVAGIAPSLADLPASGVVGYDGIAVGTEYTVASETGLPVGGTFALQYDFGANRGNFDLNIGSVNLSTEVLGNPLARARYSAEDISSTSEFSLTGGFFEGDGRANAATGGEFRHTARGTSGDIERQTVGIFVGDAN